MTVGQKILSEIAEHGPMPFSRFMELALYCPECGYYEKEADTLGRHGDYYTSAKVGGLFGELLAFQFENWIRSMELAAPGSATGKWALVEGGAHDGTLARDILRWMRVRRPARMASLEYVIVEPSATRRRWQERTLADFAGHVRWIQNFTQGGSENQGVDEPARFRGVIFANELIDAMPVRRLGWDAHARHWFEWGVKAVPDKLEWTRLDLSPEDAKLCSGLLGCPASILEVLPDGFTTEICPAATGWWRDAASSLAEGRLVTFDYGLTADERFQPHRHRGTLRSFHRHHQVPDVLAQPGEQDITAHVNFTAIQRAGEAEGLQTEELETQRGFLTRIAAEALKPDCGFGEWESRRTRQFQTLTHPEHLGHAFRVLVQRRLRSNAREHPECGHQTGYGVNNLTL